jgi:hypothetical protein
MREFTFSEKKKMKVIDQLFKWAVLLVACGYLYVLSRYVQNERYAIAPQAAMYNSVVLDKQTGTLYSRKSGISTSESWIEFHPQTGEAMEHSISAAK